MSKPIRVLVVDDSSFIRKALLRMLEVDPIEVVGLGTTGTEAVALAKKLRPDVIIMDINMPELDGLSALKRIMAENPIPVLMLSTLTREGAEATLKALELGAVDFLDKSRNGTVMDIYGLAPVLREKVATLAGADLRRISSAALEYRGAAPIERTVRHPGSCDFDLVLVGASTGGPRALMEIVAGLPGDFGASVLVAQHMPAGFTTTLADRLDRNSLLSVREAADGDELEPGSIFLAPGGTQVSVERRGSTLTARITEGTADFLHRPSVNNLFESGAKVVGARAVGVILTGMGEDGASGLAALRSAGARTIAESEATAIIYGMPRAARASAEQILPIQEIGPALATLCRPSENERERNR